MAALGVSNNDIMKILTTFHISNNNCLIVYSKFKIMEKIHHLKQPYLAQNNFILHKIKIRR